MTTGTIEVQTNGWHFVQIPTEVIRERELSIGARLVFSLLASYPNVDKQAWPSEQTLAELTGVSPRTIRKWIGELKVRGWVAQKRRKQKSAIYVLNSLPDRKPASDQDNQERKDASHQGKQDRKPASDQDRQDRNETSALEGQDRKSGAAKTGSQVPPNDNQGTIDTEISNDNQNLAKTTTSFLPAPGGAERAAIIVAEIDLSQSVPAILAALEGQPEEIWRAVLFAEKNRRPTRRSPRRTLLQAIEAGLDPRPKVQPEDAELARVVSVRAFSWPVKKPLVESDTKQRAFKAVKEIRACLDDEMPTPHELVWAYKQETGSGGIAPREGSAIVAMVNKHRPAYRRLNHADTQSPNGKAGGGRPGQDPGRTGTAGPGQPGGRTPYDPSRYFADGHTTEELLAGLPE